MFSSPFFSFPSGGGGEYPVARIRFGGYVVLYCTSLRWIVGMRGEMLGEMARGGIVRGTTGKGGGGGFGVWRIMRRGRRRRRREGNFVFWRMMRRELCRALALAEGRWALDCGREGGMWRVGK